MNPERIGLYAFPVDPEDSSSTGFAIGVICFECRHQQRAFFEGVMPTLADALRWGEHDCPAER